MGLRAVTNPAAGGQPGSFTSLTATSLTVNGLSTMTANSASPAIDITQNGAGFSLRTNSPAQINGYLDVQGAIYASADAYVTGSISASTGVSLGVNAPLQFTAGSGTAPYLQHPSNTLDVKQGTSGLRVLNNAGTVALLGMTDGATTQMSVTGSISATDYLAGAEQTPPSAPAANGYRIFAQDNGAGKTQLMVIFATGAAQQIAIEP